MTDRLRVSQESAGKHRRKRQGNKTRHKHRHADCYGELAEQPAYQTSHEKDRNKHGGKRQRHAYYRKADLFGALDCSLERSLAHFHVSHNILKHYDGIIHDESDRKRQRHQRQIVETVSAQVHHCKGPDNRHRQCKTWYQCGRDIAKKHKYNQHNQEQE